MSLSSPVSITKEVIHRVAECENTEPKNLDPPLYEVVDPDALETILLDERTESDIRVEFTYCGYDVLVTKNGVADITLND
ncbi:HalOD1 output domain-containing protein [Haloprofundus salilacus]|uniref:HalOD1 output domain-containing protein n=1 Tax=Haloprofundus salilacus TaxID=2876190 RepID=UPI001CCEE745|nr:HalOD1 output domain-containing protein [Haloprofundus salilacus]